MKVAWRRQDMRVLRMPAVCAITGRPAAGRSGVWFGKHRTQPTLALVQLGIDIANRPVVVHVPMSEPVLRRHNRLRTLGWICLLGLLTAITITVVVRSVVGIIVYGAFLIIGIGWSILLSNRLNRVGGSVDGDWIAMNQVALQFADALAAANPPGMVQITNTPGSMNPSD